VGDQSQYVLGCGEDILEDGLMLSYLYCRDCPKENCGEDKTKRPVAFIYGNEYEAFLLDLRETEWDALTVRDETGEIQDYCLLSDFRIVNDSEEVLKVRNARLRCTIGDDGSGRGLIEGQEYECIGYSWQDSYVFYVADGTGGTHPYPAERFEIINDPHGTLDKLVGTEVFWWERPEYGEPVHKDEIEFLFDPEANAAAYFSIHKKGRARRKITATAEIENNENLVLADYSVFGEIPEGIEILSFDCYAADRMFVKDGSYWLNIGSTPPINLELPDEALEIMKANHVVQEKSCL